MGRLWGVSSTTCRISFHSIKISTHTHTKLRLSLMINDDVIINFWPEVGVPGVASGQKSSIYALIYDQSKNWRLFNKRTMVSHSPWSITRGGEKTFFPLATVASEFSNLLARPNILVINCHKNRDKDRSIISDPITNSNEFLLCFHSIFVAFDFMAIQRGLQF